MVEVLANTDMLIKMLANGIVPRLPEVQFDDRLRSQHPDFKPVSGEQNDIVPVEYDCDEEVQCIAIDDEDHLYITDDYIPTHNTSNIVFLKSTDDSMLDTLQKMSGTRHVVRKDGKTVTRDVKAMFKMQANEGKVSITMSNKEEPVISYNDMAFISERNSIVFRAGDSPIWNRNETILPMSWRLFKNTIKQPGKDYTLMTVPTLSTAMDFDVRKNQPNFAKMLEKRMEQAYISEDAQQKYRDAYGYDDYAIEQLDPDTYSDEIMDLIYSTLQPQEVKDAIAAEGADRKDDIPDDDEYEEMFDYIFGNQSNKGSKFTVEQDIYNEFEHVEDNKEQLEATQEQEMKQKANSLLRYAGKQISRDMLVSPTGYSHGLDEAIIRVYKDIFHAMEKDKEYFTVVDGCLCSVDGKVYIRNDMAADDREALNAAAQAEDKRVFADEDISAEDIKSIGSYSVTNEFLKFLVSFPGAWPFANGEFEARMKAEMKDGADYQ